MLRSHAMTIGQLSRRTGVPIKVLRTYEDLGFLYTRGRSESNYRLFGEETLWCVQVVQGLRSLGLTLKELQVLTTSYLERSGEPADGLLQEQLAQALARIETHITALQALRHRILEFQAALSGAPARPVASALMQLLASDPRRGTEHPPSLLTLPPGGACTLSSAPLGEEKNKPSHMRLGLTSMARLQETGGFRP
jgi:DNA-binding transcriptional MerR regulator